MTNAGQDAALTNEDRATWLKRMGAEHDAFASAAYDAGVAAERERCARVCEAEARKLVGSQHEAWDAVRNCLDAIRSNE